MSTLIFDGDCGFCTNSALWLKKRMKTGHIVSWQMIDDLAEYELTVDDVTSAAWWITDEGRKLRGERSIAGALKDCKGFWRLCGVILELPIVRHIAAPIYTWIARNRHNMPGATAACRIDDRR